MESAHNLRDSKLKFIFMLPQRGPHSVTISGTILENNPGYNYPNKAIVLSGPRFS
jgi:hypothetical protein